MELPHIAPVHGQQSTRSKGLGFSGNCCFVVANPQGRRTDVRGLERMSRRTPIMSKTAIRLFDQASPDISDASILVTGGTGSFGRAFVRRLLDNSPPRRLVIFSRE
jgi:hypothetical protein